MKTWDEYKNYVKSIDEESKKEIEQIEAIAHMVGDMNKRPIKSEKKPIKADKK